jgi:hypothetical protein
VENIDQQNPDPSAPQAADPETTLPAPAPTPVEPAPVESPVEVIAPSFVIPDFSAASTEQLAWMPPWVEDDYENLITGSGAAKLADSAVAPLVAAARGYERLKDTNAKEGLKKTGVKGNSKQGRALMKSFDMGRDAMAMPWYSAADLNIARRDKTRPTPISWQIRPEDPAEAGLPKYVFVTGSVTPLDVHPATPLTWLDSTDVVIFAEGMLKGDSALSAYLHANGASWDELKWDGHGDPLTKLDALFERVPEQNRRLIVSIAGVHNTSSNPIDWREIKFKEREAWLAFDADYSTNANVHQAAAKLRDHLLHKSKVSAVKFLFPEVHTDDGTMEKAGVDDYLARTGSWDSLMATVQAKLPPAPPRNDQDKNGAWRCSSDGTVTEECKAVPDPLGEGALRFQWEPRVDMGGHIKSLEILRQPTDDEILTGRFQAEVEPHDVQATSVEIQLEWMEDGIKQSSIVTGPDSILAYAPDQWLRHGAHLPQAILRHPAWPPTGKDGVGFMKAIKAHRKGDQQNRTRWTQMGWVPVPGGDPVFLIGDQVVGELDVNAHVVAGVTERELGPTRHFGVGEMSEDADFNDPEYQRLVREDITKVTEHYLINSPWTDPATAVLVMGTGLRPTVPLRPRSTLYLTGSKGSGKSWTAKACMWFWARRGSDWQDMLPGSAKDTLAYSENALSKAPIWVLDDLAPSASKRQAEAEEAKIADMVRSSFNNAAKGRMNADMTTRTVNKPIAQMIITAENELNTPSAKERVIHLNIGKGALTPETEPTDALVNLALDDGAPARLSQHLLRFVRFEATRTAVGATWSGFMTNLGVDLENLKTRLQEDMREAGAKSGSMERISSLASDSLLAFNLLERMADHVGVDEEIAEHLEANSLSKPVVQLLVGAHAENQSAAPGASLSRALSKMLKEGGAHIVSAADPMAAPVRSGYSGEVMENMDLGWKYSGSGDGTLTPSGPRIGVLVYNSDDVPIVVFDQEAAFKHAKRNYETLIQHGQGHKVAWRAMWDEKIADGLAREKDGNSLRVTSRVTVGASRTRGVPVPLDTVLNDGVTPTEEELREIKEGRTLTKTAA